MAFGHGREHQSRRARTHRHNENRRTREGNNGAQEKSSAEIDKMISAIQRNLAAQCNGKMKPTRQGVLNLIGKFMSVRSKSFDEAVHSMRFSTRGGSGARNTIQFANHHGVYLFAEEIKPSTETEVQTTGMARTKKQEEQRRQREEREAQQAAGKPAATKGGAEGAGASKRAAGGKRRTPRQPTLPDPEGKGFKQEGIAEIDAATESYLTFRDEHATATTNLKNAKAHLMAMMKKNGRTTYNFEGQVVEYSVEEAEDVKVHKVARKKTGEDEPNEV